MLIKADYSWINTPERTAGTISEQSINVVDIDTSNNTVTIKRIGAGNDISYNYHDLTGGINYDSNESGDGSGDTGGEDTEQELIKLTEQIVVDYKGSSHTINNDTNITINASTSVYVYIIVKGLTSGKTYNLKMLPDVNIRTSVYSLTDHDANDDSSYDQRLLSPSVITDGIEEQKP